MPRATCAELIGLCCAVCLLVMPPSDQQYGCNLRKTNLIERRQEVNESENTCSLYTYMRTGTCGTWYFSHDTWYYCIGKKAQRSTAQHSTAGQKPRDRTALRCAAEL